MSLRTFILGVSLALPVFIFFILHIYWVVNIPVQDDFDGLLNPVLLWNEQAKTWQNIVEILTTQDDERRVIMNRIMAITITEIFGYLDFRWMKWVGLSLNFILVGLLANLVEKKRWSYWTLLPTLLVLFSQANYNALNWAMIPIQQIGVFIWGIVAIWALVRGKIVWALIAGCLSVASDVSGILILPAGIVTLILRRDWRNLFLWMMCIGCVVILYMYDLKVPDYRPSFSQNIREWPSILGIIWVSPSLIIDVFLDSSMTRRIMLSSLFSLPIWVFVVKVSRVYVLSYIKGKSIDNDEIWIIGSIFFLLSTVLVFALGRSSEGVQSIFDSRYRHIFHILWIFTWYLFLMRGYSIKWVQWSIVITSLWHIWVIYITWGYHDYQRQVYQTDMYSWHEQRGMPSTGIYYTLRDEVDSIIEKADSMGIYKVDNFPFAPLANAKISGRVKARWINATLQSQGIEISTIERGIGKNQGNYLVLKSQNTSYILPIRHQRLPIWSAVLFGNYYDSVGHSIIIQHHMIQPGKYQVLVGKLGSKEWILLDTQLTYEPTLPVGS